MKKSEFKKLCEMCSSKNLQDAYLMAEIIVNGSYPPIVVRKLCSLIMDNSGITRGGQYFDDHFPELGKLWQEVYDRSICDDVRTFKDFDKYLEDD